MKTTHFIQYFMTVLHHKEWYFRFISSARIVQARAKKTKQKTPNNQTQALIQKATGRVTNHQHVDLPYQSQGVQYAAVKHCPLNHLDYQPSSTCVQSNVAQVASDTPDPPDEKATCSSGRLSWEHIKWNWHIWVQPILIWEHYRLFRENIFHCKVTQIVRIHPISPRSSVD